MSRLVGKLLIRTVSVGVTSITTAVCVTTTPIWGPKLTSLMYRDNMFDLRNRISSDTKNIMTSGFLTLALHRTNENEHEVDSIISGIKCNVLEGRTFIAQYLLDTGKITMERMMRSINQGYYYGLHLPCDEKTIDFLKKNDMIRLCDDSFLVANYNKSSLIDQWLAIAEYTVPFEQRNRIKIKLLSRNFVTQTADQFVQALDRFGDVILSPREHVANPIDITDIDPLMHIPDIKQKLITLERAGIEIIEHDKWIDTLGWWISIAKKNHDTVLVKEFEETAQYIASFKGVRGLKDSKCYDYEVDRYIKRFVGFDFFVK